MFFALNLSPLVLNQRKRSFDLCHRPSSVMETSDLENAGVPSHAKHNRSHGKPSR